MRLHLHRLLQRHILSLSTISTVSTLNLRVNRMLRLDWLLDWLHWRNRMHLILSVTCCTHKVRSGLAGLIL